MKIEKRNEIVFLMSTGHTARQIGGKLGLKETTVAKYVEMIKTAVGAANGSHLVGIAFRSGWIK